MVQLSTETHLRNEPTEKGRTLGVLPAGTLLTSKGQTLGKYLRVEVELEGGQRLEGWVNRSYLEREAPPNVDQANEDELQRKKAQRRRIKIPEDEALLISRAPSFMYGATLGPVLTIIESGTTSDIYSGMGVSGGGYVGTWLSKFVPLRFETLFSLAAGSNGQDTVQFNFMDLALYPSYLMGPVELFVGGQYSICLGLGELPGAMVVADTNELSGFWWFAGLGYQIELGKDTMGSIRFRYASSSKRETFGFQSIGLLFSAELRG